MKKLFLSYTYAPHPDYAAQCDELQRGVRIVAQAMGIRVDTGEDLGGGGLSPEVKARIEDSDALLAIVTPQLDAGNKVLPQWVLDEYTYAKTLGKSAIRVIHVDLNVGGMHAGDQHIKYGAVPVPETLISVMRTIGLWKGQIGRAMRIEIAPTDVGRRFRSESGHLCSYQLLRDDKESSWRPAKVFPEPGAIYAYLNGVPDEAKLRLRLQVDGETWQSDFNDPIGRLELKKGNAMSVTIAQDATYVGEDYWNWSVWLEGEPAELDRITEVTWNLHPSFTPSVVASRDRASGFRLETSGWGTFVIRATARRSDGSEQRLRHTLELFYPDDQAAASKEEMARKSGPFRGLAAAESKRGPQVFLSYGSEDRVLADQVRVTLEGRGMQVWDQSKLEAGSPWEITLRDKLRDSDAVVAVVSSEFPSPFLVQEVRTAMAAGKPTLVLAGEKVESVLGLADMQLGHIKADKKFEVAGLDDWLKKL